MEFKDPPTLVHVCSLPIWEAFHHMVSLPSGAPTIDQFINWLQRQKQAVPEPYRHLAVVSFSIRPSVKEVLSDSWSNCPEAVRSFDDIEDWYITPQQIYVTIDYAMQEPA